MSVTGVVIGVVVGVGDGVGDGGGVEDVTVGGSVEGGCWVHVVSLLMMANVDELEQFV